MLGRSEIFVFKLCFSVLICSLEVLRTIRLADDLLASKIDFFLFIKFSNLEYRSGVA